MRMDYVVYIAIGIAIFNTIVHSILGLLLLRSPERGKKIWAMMAPSVPYEQRACGIKYLVCTCGIEVHALLWWAWNYEALALQCVLLIQIFVICGGGAYDAYMMSSPPNTGEFVNKLTIFGGLNSAALYKLQGSRDSFMTQAFQLLQWTFLGFVFNSIIVDIIRYRRVGKLAIQQVASDSSTPAELVDSATQADTAAPMLPPAPETKDKDL